MQTIFLFMNIKTFKKKCLYISKKKKKKIVNFKKKLLCINKKFQPTKKKCLNLDEKINLFNNKNFLLLFSTLI